MRVVYKYPLLLGAGPQVETMPEGARIVHVHEQDERPYLWAEVNTDRNIVERTFYVVATGEPLPDIAPKYLYHKGTIHIGWTVWHVFEVEEPF